MSTRNIARILGLAVAMAWVLLSAPVDTRYASADPCPDVEVVFARGTNEPPGFGTVGQAFVYALRSQVPERSVGGYAVNYPATDDFASSLSAGSGDARAHVQSMVANCPSTRLVLGGYSQGAGVIDMTTCRPRWLIMSPRSSCSATWRVQPRGRWGAPRSLRSARFIAPRRLTCASPTTQSAPRATARLRTVYTFSPA
jgi:hypothetical protein